MTQACILMPAVSINVYLFIYLFFKSPILDCVLSTNPKRAETILFSSIICQTIYV